MIRIEITAGEIDIGAAFAPLAALGGGAVASFTGIARGDGGVVVVELEHYPGMTEVTLRGLADEAALRWSLLGCVIVHRVGRIETGETIVLVGTAASHRAEALAACSFLIDRLKTDAPFWKKEHRADGTAHWVEAKDSDADRAAEWLGDGSERGD